MNVDIKFIAKKAGVSPATVSRVLNNSKYVSEGLQEKVMQEVAKYNYRPNYLARWLILNKSNLIGVIAPNVSNVFHAEIISNIEQYANQHQYNVIVSNVYSSYEKLKNSFEIMRDRRVDGLILLHESDPEQMKVLEQMIDVPVVLTSVNVKDTSLITVGIDDERAAFDAVSYLIRLGHKRIAGVFSNSYSLGGLRQKGYVKALEQNDLPVIPEYVIETGCSIPCGAEAAEVLFRHLPRPTAMFCAADELAIGATNYLLDQEYRLPADMSIFGFDDINLATVIRPNLSTIRQPIGAIGRKAAELLIASIEGQEIKEKRIIFPHQLIVRDSCLPLQ